MSTRHALSASDSYRTTIESPRADFYKTLLVASFFVYLLANRLIQDIYVLPVGLSIRPWEPVLALVLVTWALWMITQPKPLPRGVVGLVGLLLIAVLIGAYFVNAPDFTLFQANASDRGIERVVLFSGLFLASYHLARDRETARRFVMVIVSLTIVQGLIGVYEFLIGRNATFLHNLWTSLGLQADPRGLRVFNETIKARLTGELRAMATAPNPLVLSAVLALGSLVTFALLAHTSSRRKRKHLFVLLLIQMASMPLTNSRSGFVILIGVGLVLPFLTIRQWPKMLPFGLWLAVAMGIMFALVPRSARLLLNSFTRPQNDPNLEVRLERIDRVPELMEKNPFLGAGYMTNDVDIIVFDNAFNLGLVEMGIIGFMAILAFFLVCIGRSWSGLARAETGEEPLMLAGVIGGLSVIFAATTFDAWTFDQFLPTTIILMGIGVGTADVAHRRSRAATTGATVPEREPAEVGLDG